MRSQSPMQIVFVAPPHTRALACELSTAQESGWEKTLGYKNPQREVNQKCNNKHTRGLKVSKQHGVHERDHREEKQNASCRPDRTLIEYGYAIAWYALTELK